MTSNNIGKTQAIKLVFWQNIPSIHQAPLLRAVAKIWPGELTMVAENDVSDSRLAQGWARPDFLPGRLVVAPSEKEKLSILGEKGKAVHIFSGFHAYPGTYDVFKKAIRRGHKVGVFAEPGSSGDFKSLFRRFRNQIHAVRWAGSLIFLLATGELGVRYYSKCGFPVSKIFPFAYFVEQANIKRAAPVYIGSWHQVDSPFSLLFVGQLIRRKGIDILLSALSQIRSSDWVLNVVGHGEDREALMQSAQKKGIAEKVNWLGTLPNEKARLLTLKADCLVLPSRHDGWGAVVNEALLAGTPVIVSDACGSCDLIRDDWLGDIFLSCSSYELANIIERRVLKGRLQSQERLRIKAWAEKAISPFSGAQYLVEIINYYHGGESGPPPIAPWQKMVEPSSL